MATLTATTQQEENPRITPDQQQQQPSSDPPSHSNASLTPQQSPLSATGTDSSRKEGNGSKSVGDSPETGLKNDDNNDSPVSDIQKKIRRAERFGMTVQLSEEDKRNSRAERFGAGTPIHGSDALKKSEEQKRKDRAERFGLVQSVPATEEAKKKARLDRFAAVPKTDPLEEGKKKARAIRFSQPGSGSVSQVNGKGNDIETKTAIIDKASGGI